MDAAELLSIVKRYGEACTAKGSADAFLAATHSQEDRDAAIDAAHDFECASEAVVRAIATLGPTIPRCISRMTCEDVAECVGDIGEDLRAALWSFGGRGIGDAWFGLSANARDELTRGALAEEALCASLGVALTR